MLEIPAEAEPLPFAPHIPPGQERSEEDETVFARSGGVSTSSEQEEERAEVA